ncbi:MAG TPA: bifunctional serine/threonine protein kinase/MFS transporter [Ktedonobacteraceae bacterium]|nr:bifunctional serine/threonine protein kinase/MFS transporter [Ktedonobacteraceae bacterium]
MENRVGQQLGNYRLIRLLGVGGFAEVYLGEHIHLQTQSAIKLLHTQLANEDVEHFRNEARTLARLVHPNIVRVFDFGVENRTPYLVMDYAPNGTLRQRHPRGTILPLPTIVSYVKQIADALQYAHDEKCIHRDIKPENMLIGRRNEILLSDFGIAIVAQSSRLQSTQDVIGTVSYMAPEQIQAHPRPASDQYSLGIIVYEWLCGSVPFVGSFAEVAVKHTVAPVPSLRERISSISPAVEQVVMTALQKDPHSRFSTVGAFANAFEQASHANQKQAFAPIMLPSAALNGYQPANKMPGMLAASSPPGQAQSSTYIIGNNPALTSPAYNIPAQTIPQIVSQPLPPNVSSNTSAPLQRSATLPGTSATKIKRPSKALIYYLFPMESHAKHSWRNVLLYGALGAFILLIPLTMLKVLLAGGILRKRYSAVAALLITIFSYSIFGGLQSNYAGYYVYFGINSITAFIVSWLCEQGLGHKFYATIITMLFISILLSAGFALLGFFNSNYLILVCLQGLFAGIILPLLWKLPRVKRNMAKE